MRQAGYPDRMFERICPLVFSLMLAAPFPALAEVRAVLVGVSDYLVLDADLKGPSSDVALMATVLAARGVTDQVALTTGGTAPTKAAIMAALDKVAARSVAGDTVVFYFSGHGGQAPDQSGDEGGGNDEIFLPADAAGWKGAIGAVENAVLDDELQAWAQPLLARGVQLVGLIDACHSDTGFRAVGRGVARGLGAEALGIPADAVSDTGPQAAPLAGDFVFLYSSQSDQRSFEYEVGTSGEWHGAFTLKLAEVLRTATGASWGQVLAATADGMIQGQVPQMPDGEGPLLQNAVFGMAAPARFLIRDGAVQAGLLQGLAEGDQVAVFADAAAGPELAMLPLTRVTAREARFDGDLPPDAAWAEVAIPAAPAPLALAPSVRPDPSDGFDYSAWTKILGAGQPDGDLVPILTGGELALAGPDGVLDPMGAGSTPRVQPVAGETQAEALARVLENAGHALRLRKVLAAVAGRGLTGKPAFSVTWQKKPAAVDGAGCARAGPPAPVDPAQGLRPCDQLWAEIRNSSGRDLDVSVLYFNADFTIGAVWPSQGLSNRLAAGEVARAGVQIDPQTTVGLEEIMVLAVPVEYGSPRVDLTALASPMQMRGSAGPAGWISDQLATEDRTRGFSTRPAALNMVRQPVRLLPDP